MTTTRPLDARLRAICALSVPSAREEAGRHEYDGVVQDLSPDGVRRSLAALGGPAGTAPYPDPHDEAHAAAGERALRVRFGELELHRSNPAWHIANLDLSGYDREYAPRVIRNVARLTHLRYWPDAVDMAVTALDRVPAPTARATLPAARGLAAQLDGRSGGPYDAARAAHARLIAHLEHAAEHGEPSAALGSAALTRLLSSSEAVDVDLDRLADRAEAERDRLHELLEQACRRVDPDAAPEATVRRLLADHPAAEDVVAEATALTREVIAWTAGRGLVPYDDGECRVGLVPPSRTGEVATMDPAAAYEADGPSWFRIGLPPATWPPREQDAWLSVFSRTTLPNIAIHEVAPGHYSHGRALRRVPGDVRRTVRSEVFTEGWAHYGEELALEEGFRADDPRFAVGVARDALWRLTRLATVIGQHTGAMSVEEAAARYTADAFLDGPAASVSAERGMLNPASIGYTWGKLALRDLRDRAHGRWGTGFSLRRFHAAVLSLGAPPIGLLDTALERG
ncbi:hypothetical protein ACZ90_44305 [Streptomyces albus subsp. albus]|nr:hypothetical protein ACZ90_44305 [Streptomyces albus subsp. albus]